MEQHKKILLIDSHALIYRAYFAFINNPRINSKGVNTSAPFGFITMYLDVVKKLSPTHIIAAFDPKGPTFRHTIFPQYKAHREETPEALRLSIPTVISILEALQVPVISLEGFEADDVIGALAKKYAKEGFTVYMLTPDKDYCQLVEESIFVYRPKSFGPGYDVLGIEEVKEKFSIQTPMQLIDILALWGDTSDNIPGAPGIGEKRAKELIQNYHSIEGIYEHIYELKGKQKENLIAFKEQVMLSKYLVTIKTDLEVEFDIEKSKATQPNRNELITLFNELEFRTLTTRFFEDTSSQPKVQKQPIQKSLFDEIEEPKVEPVDDKYFETIQTIEHSYIAITSEVEIDGLVQTLGGLSEFCFDTETTSLQPIDAEIVGLSVTWKSKEAFYVSFPKSQEETLRLISKFKPIFENEQIKKVGQNLKYDINILANYSITVKGELFDTLIAHYLIQPESKHSLDALALQYFNYKMVPIEELIGKKGATQASFRTVPLEVAKEYAGEDADLTYQLKPILEKELAEKGHEKLFREIEMPVVSILARIERAGVALNTKELDLYSIQIRKDIQSVEQEIYTLAGEHFNIASPKQLGDILFDKLKISDKAKRTKTKQYATGEEILVDLQDEHEIVRKILEYRSLTKLLSTYVETLPKLINSKTGRIHTSFNQAVVATGRLSSTNPNLQNIPIKTEKGREIRRAFTTDSANNVFISADYSQIELRVIAHISKDEAFIEAFRNKEDIHAATAAKIFNIPLTSVTSEQRRQAKSANFAISYGASAFGIAQNLKISRTDAKYLIDGYFASYPRVKEYMEKQIDFAREYGYVETLFGRRRYLPDITSNNATVRGFAERNAINAPIQGTAADIVKIAMNNVQKKLDESDAKTRMIMQVHDELNFEAPIEEQEMAKNIIVTNMEQAVQLTVPLLVEIGIGNNWLEAH